MKRYVMVPRSDGDKVLVYDEQEKKQGKLRNCPLGRAHSPTGFAWGYHGSGPSALAASILWDALGDKVKCPSCMRRGKSRNTCYDCGHDGAIDGFRGMYQRFKEEIVAAHPMKDGWSITEGEVFMWAQRYASSRGMELEL